ncbi:TIGR03745 family integrating conjugative element membrane protein [Dickeya oryzae]|nr:TIGR03745 family integrating conjugative element membrane protein [Dickeya oryzae]
MEILNVMKNLLNRIGQACLLVFLSFRAYADLPAVEAPSTGGGGGLFNSMKGYLRDGFTLGGLVVAVVAFIVVANAAISCFHHVRQGKATWTEFGAFIIVGVVLLVAVIWLLTKAADIL